MLIITEKPSVARDFAKALDLVKQGGYLYGAPDKKIKVTHCMGHLLEMKEPHEYDKELKKWDIKKLPIIPEEIEYREIKETKEILRTVVREIKEAVRNGEEIIIATDAGREGEVIGRLVVKKAGAEKYSKLFRFWESEALTQEVVKRGIESREKLEKYDRLAEEGFSWKASDWVYGVNTSRLLSVMNGKLLTIGRVQTAVLRELYKREKEIREFKKKEYEELVIKIGDGCKAVLINPETKEKKFKIGSEYVRKALKSVEGSRVKIASIEKEEKKELPPRLYNITGLERDAFRVFGYKPEKTLELAQKLYEKEKSLSYPRTPSRVMGESNVEMVKKIMKEHIGRIPGIEEYIDEEAININNKRVFNNKELEDHHALIPLKYMENDNSDEYWIWRLVQIRFLQQAMRPFWTEYKRVIYEKEGYQFTGLYREVKEQGWRMVELKGEENDEWDSGIECEENIEIEVEEAVIEKKSTRPKRYYDYDSLLSWMENPKGEEGEKLIGIGTAATRPAILAMLNKRKYTVEERKVLRISEVGEYLVEKVLKNEVLEKNTTAETTTEWERLAKENPVTLYEKTKEVVLKAITLAKGENEMKTEREVMGKCPACGGNILEGKNNYFCSNYKEENGGCTQKVYKHILGVEVTKDMVKTLCKVGRIGFYEGTNKDGENVTFGIEIKENEFSVKYTGTSRALGKCPKCGKNIRIGKKAYYCDGIKSVPKCTYVLWRETNGAVFLPNMIEALLRKESVEDVECKTKSGENYRCGFRLDEKGELVKIIYGGQARA